MRVLFALFTCLLMFAPSAHAQQRVTLLIDAELDDYLNALAKPLLEAADINPENVVVHVIQDSTINAFVNSQRDIYVNSGLILNADNENEVAGVLAHEIGHMKGHHLLRMSEKQDQALLPILLSGIAGVGMAVAGAPNAGVAVIAGGQAAGISELLKFSRSQEQQADQIAVSLLDKTNASNQGLKDFFGRLRTNQLLYHKSPPAYLVTHPRPADRESFLDRVQSKPFVASDRQKLNFERIKAKTMVISTTTAQARRHFMNRNDAVANYARAIAFAIEGQYADAITALKKAEPELGKDAAPYIIELLGQMATDGGNLKAARDYFEKAVELAPHSAILRFEYARALADNKEYAASLPQFDRVIHRRQTWWLPYYYQGLAYGKSGQEGVSHLSLAIADLYSYQKDDGLFHIQVAEKLLKEEAKEKGKDNTLALQKAAQVKLELENLGK